MGLRPARCYRQVERPYTRTAKRRVRKALVKGVPDPRIRIFDMGNTKKDYKYEVRLVAQQDVQIRHNALEAIRVFLNKKLDKAFGKDNYWLKILVYPHHVMRENALLTGAGADRLQTGMKHAFGKPIGRAAQVDRGQVVLRVRVMTDKAAEKARQILKSVTPKLPLRYKVEVVEIATARSS